MRLRCARRRAVVVQFAHVLLQIEVATESLAAQLARERLLVVVRVHVERQVVDLMEGLVAHATLVLLVGGVRQLVVLVVALLVEALTAVLANERLVALVDAHVRVERRRPVERLLTGAALVRFLRRVDDLVATQRARLAEALAAHLAHEGPRPRVHGHVSGEVVVRVEDLPALGTRERLRRLHGGRLPGRVDGAGATRGGLARGDGDGGVVDADFGEFVVESPTFTRRRRQVQRRVALGFRRVDLIVGGDHETPGGRHERSRVVALPVSVELRHLQGVGVVTSVAVRCRRRAHVQIVPAAELRLVREGWEQRTGVGRAHAERRVHVRPLFRHGQQASGGSPAVVRALFLLLLQLRQQPEVEALRGGGRGDRRVRRYGQHRKPARRHFR